MEKTQSIDCKVVHPVKDGSLLADIVKFRIQFPDGLSFDLVVHILLESCLDEQWPRGKEQIVEGNVVVIEHCLPTEAILECEVNMRDSHHQVLVEEVQN